MDDKIVVRYERNQSVRMALEEPSFLNYSKVYAFEKGFAVLAPAHIHRVVLCHVALFNFDEGLSGPVATGFLEHGVYNSPSFASFDDCLATIWKDGCSIRVVYKE